MNRGAHHSTCAPIKSPPEGGWPIWEEWSVGESRGGVRGAKKSKRKCSAKVLARMRENFAKLKFSQRVERLVAKKLRANGIPCELVAQKRLPYDITTKTGNIEVKAARLVRGKNCVKRDRGGKRMLRLRPFWTVSIARQGRMNEAPVTWYVVYLGKHTDLHPVYLVLKAPLRKRHLRITLRQLITKWAQHVDRWDLLKEEK